MQTRQQAPIPQPSQAACSPTSVDIINQGSRHLEQGRYNQHCSQPEERPSSIQWSCATSTAGFPFKYSDIFVCQTIAEVPEVLG